MLSVFFFMKLTPQFLRQKQTKMFVRMYSHFMPPYWTLVFAPKDMSAFKLSISAVYQTSIGSGPDNCQK